MVNSTSTSAVAKLPHPLVLKVFKKNGRAGPSLDEGFPKLFDTVLVQEEHLLPGVFSHAGSYDTWFLRVLFFQNARRQRPLAHIVVRAPYYWSPRYYLMCLVGSSITGDSATDKVVLVKPHVSHGCYDQNINNLYEVYAPEEGSARDDLVSAAYETYPGAFDGGDSGITMPPDDEDDQSFVNHCPLAHLD